MYIAYSTNDQQETCTFNAVTQRENKAKCECRLCFAEPDLTVGDT